jgi:ComF family protein
MPLRRILSLLAPPLCAACGSVAGAAEPLCGRCRAALRWLGASVARAGPLSVWAPVAYEGPARALVRGLKFASLVKAADTMAAHIAANAPPGWLRHGRLVPVPLHPARMRTRGYNQAERLAAAVGSRIGLPVDDCLARAGPATTQVGRDRAERLSGIAGAVTLREGGEPPARAIVVDDVMTTGATLAACANALTAAGTADAVGLAYARTPGR